MKCVLAAVLLSYCAVVAVQAGQQVATIRHITVRGDDHDLDVEISATMPVTPLTQTVTDPDRLIVDLPEARPAAGLQKILISRGNLKGVRVGLLKANPPITRVVLDLTAPTAYRVSPLANTIVVKLGNRSGPESAPIARTTKLEDVKPAENTSVVPTPPPDQSSERSRARWILPTLVVGTVFAMLVIAVVAHLQNKRGSRGL
jgi:type IV pilus assembly protein PilQ